MSIEGPSTLSRYRRVTFEEVESDALQTSNLNLVIVNWVEELMKTLLVAVLSLFELHSHSCQRNEDISVDLIPELA